MNRYFSVLFLIFLRSSIGFHSTAFSSVNNRYSLKVRGTVSESVETAPFADIIPFLSEHVQPSDMILFIGAQTDLPLQLIKNRYGTEKTGFISVVDSNKMLIEELSNRALADPEIKSWMDTGKLKFEAVDLTDMPSICQQSTVDAIIDYGGLDSLLNAGDESGVLKCIDHLQDAVRLGNILVCLSKLEKNVFCAPFEKRFGWVQELDGDPGEISAWYRGKSNVQATKSNFQELGLKMYVYTNTDNC
mmetsp:Transcript_33358/g.31829  ORF Transcript_33358/g.31829 Transcript_33358/m.31829 type:complete len:246 (+) Transcript_33358:127-864(+)